MENGWQADRGLDGDGWKMDGRPVGRLDRRLGGTGMGRWIRWIKDGRRMDGGAGRRLLHTVVSSGATGQALGFKPPASHLAAISPRTSFCNLSEPVPQEGGCTGPVEGAVNWGLIHVKHTVSV